MKQAIYGLILYIFLMLPPVISISESIMVLHMHMQMPLLVIVGMLFTPFLRERFSSFFTKWNENGIPGVLLFLIIIIYWMIPRAMDEAIANPVVEMFKFISLPFLAGIPLRESWRKLTKWGKNLTLISISILFTAVALLYIVAPLQLCNNYLVAEQKALGWTSLFMAVGIMIYFIQTLFIDEDEYEEELIE
jgi:hypothetical protein